MAFEDKYKHQSVILALRFILQIYPVYTLIIFCCSSKNNCSLLIHTNKNLLEMQCVHNLIFNQTCKITNFQRILYKKMSISPVSTSCNNPFQVDDIWVVKLPHDAGFA